MKVRRRADAPRLIEWTGERCVPWSEDVQVVYEHLHRYLWAANVVAGRRVLDLASGEGFGAAILSETAAEVVGCDIDPVAIEHASLNYVADTLSFTVGDARRLSQFEAGSFSAVVAFELLEHVDQQEQTLDEIKRVLGTDGVLVFSTPDRKASSGENPYHVHELSRAELESLLRTRFRNVALFGQRAVTGSELARLDRADVGPARSLGFFIERDGDAWRSAGAPEPVYLVAVASDAELPALQDGSSLADAGIELVRRAEAEAHEQVRTEFEQLRDGLEDKRKQRDVELRQSRQEIERLRARSARDSHTISSLDSSLNAANDRLRRVEGSVTWQVFQRVRERLFSLLGGEDSRAVAALQATLRSIGGRLRSTRMVSGERSRGLRGRRRASGPVAFPHFEHPAVSIVIPLYAHAELTRVALHSIREQTEHIDYEVILVDDDADSATKALLKTVSGARVIVNDENIGYLRSVKRGAAKARGRWLVLANNDIEVKAGWLAALIDCGESAPDVAIVAPKYLAPDGRLSEAGGVIWNDGTGCNYGRTEDPSGCHFQYRREIDYGSAAALLVRSDFWTEVGGFDERFLPMYYEDTDLCFEARARGLRVLYEPTAQVIHAEGSTAGVDESSSYKRHQASNRPKFVEKWRERLESEHLPPDTDPWLGANSRRSQRVLVADHRVPMWDRESGALRMRGMLEALSGLDCHVSFLPDNGMPMQPYTRELQRLGVEVLYGVDPGSALTRIAPSLSLAILSRPEVAARWLSLIRGQAAGAVIVYDTVDLHWLREARQAATATGGGDELVMTPKVTTMHELELGLIRASDVTLVVSDAERAQVIADAPEVDVVIVPNVNPVREHVPGAGWRSGILFVGGFEHPPNVDGALTLVQSVMPHVWREVSDVPVTIVGAEPPPGVQELESPLVHVAGWVADLDPLLDGARALVAPLRYGAGLKGKVTQALAVGLPVVTTAIGAEGLDAVDGEQLLIADDPEGLARKTVTLLRDDQLWAGLSREGQKLAAKMCSPELVQERLAELLERAPTRPRAGSAPVGT